MDRDRMIAAIRAAERNGAFKTMDALSIAVAEIYSFEYDVKISKSSAYQAMVRLQRSGEIRLKTKPAKIGRPKTAMVRRWQFVRDGLEILEDKAIREKWQEGDPGWSAMNQLRSALMMTCVQPVDNPSRRTFSV